MWNKLFIFLYLFLLRGICLANEGLRAQLAEQGYIASEQIVEHLSPGSLEKLNALFNQIHSNPFQPSEESNAHFTATQNSWRLSGSQNDKLLLFSATGDIDRLPSAIYKIYKDVLSILPNGHYTVNILLSDDAGQLAEKCAENHLTAFFHESTQIAWHQDKVKDLDFHYLFFMMIDTAWILNPGHRLELGLADPPESVPTSSSVIRIPDCAVTTIQALDAKPGSGYLIDQNFKSAGKVLVHRHNGWKTALIPQETRQDLPLLNLHVQHLIRHFDSAEQEEFARCLARAPHSVPARKKIIMRILKD